MNKLLTVRQVAEILGKSHKTILTYIHTGQLRATKPGGYTVKKHWRIKEADLEAFINGKEQAGAGSEHNRASK